LIVMALAVPLCGAVALHDGAARALTPVTPYVPVLRAGDHVPSVPLFDAFGKPLSFQHAAGPTIVSFMETRCADARMCPLVTAKFAQLQRLLKGTNVRLMEITLDPTYDRLPVLRRYAERAGADATIWVFATGTVPSIAALSGRFGILGTSGSNSIGGHTEAVAIVSGAGVLQSLIDGNEWSAQDVAAVARSSAGLPSDGLRRLALQLSARISAACGGSGAAGVPLLGAFAIFAITAGALGWLVFRLFHAAIFERS
jgi:cytochrome oxidase Cu insertion factor (SCO1/SenC/PrrC family)